MPTKCGCGCGWPVRSKGHFYGDHAANPPPVDTYKDAVQKLNAIYNPVYNPVHNAKVQERARVDNEERIAKMHKHEDIISEADAATLAEELSTTATGALHGCTLKELMGLDEDGYPYIADDDAPVPLETPLPYQCPFYIGYTGRHIDDEYLRWLTTRGTAELEEDGSIIAGSETRNRPVLLWPDDGIITMKQATQQLDFQYIEIYSSTLKLNARRVEKALQQRFQYLPLGVRLWRAPDKGAKYDRDDDARKVHKVFVTFSPRVAQMLRERKIKIDY
jgi:hypothetical protein